MSEEKMKGLLDMIREDIKNPAPATDFFRIPSNLPSDWQFFFERILRYCSDVCSGPNPYSHERMQWEKRQWMMKDNELDEFDMLLSAARAKENGNTEFRNGNITQALTTYIASLLYFPCPDTMNNLAACALKQHRYELAEEYTTKALNMGLITNPVAKAKALYRRSQAKRFLGKFNEALNDIKAASTLHPTDGAIQSAMKEIETLSQSISSPAALKAYIASQPKPPPPMPFMDAHKIIPDQPFFKRPDFMDFRAVKAPTF